MDALEIGGGDGVGAGPASNANTSLHALHCNIAALHSCTCMNQCSLSLITGSTIYQIYMRVRSTNGRYVQNPKVSPHVIPRHPDKGGRSYMHVHV